MITLINQALSLLTVAGQIIAVAVLVLILTKQKRAVNFFGKNAVLFSFMVALLAMLGSLFYSEIAGYEPCKLCWFQRILMYPQVLLFGIALLKKDSNIFLQSIILSSIGALIAGYNYLLQIGAAPSVSCSVVGYSAECSQRFVMQLGYITIPMMSFTAFIMIIVFMLAFRMKEKSA